LVTFIDLRFNVIMMDPHEANREKCILKEEVNTNNINTPISIPNVNKSECNTLEMTTFESFWDILNKRTTIN